MSRYSQTKKTNKKLNTTIYDSVPERNDDIYIITQEGDRLDNLASRFYKDESLWWFIARVNHLKTINVSAGTSLRIPVSLENAQGS